MKAYSAATTAGTLSGGEDINQVLEEVNKQLDKMGSEANETKAKLEAALIDEMKSVYSNLAENERTLAEQTVEIWKNAFDAIADARKKVFGDESLLEDLQDPETLRTLAEAAGMSPSEFYDAYMRGEITGESFKQKPYDVEAQKEKYGIDVLESGLVTSD